MSEDLTPRQQILLWDLVSRGGSALQKDLKPKVEPKDREPLVRAKMISVAKGKNNTIELTLADGGWDHIAATTPTLLKNGEGSKYDRPILQFVLVRVQAHAAANANSYFDIFAGKPTETTSETIVVTPTLMPIETAIRSAFFDIAGRPARDGVRLRALRERLPALDRATLDAALLRMRESGRANLMNLDNPRDIEAEGDAALKAGNQTFHILWIDA